MIQCMSDVEANRDRVKLQVLKAYHPLVVGHKHENVKRIAKATGASIHVPPSSKNSDEITITGEKKGVQQAAAEIQAIYDQLKMSCGELTANIKKAQHRFVIGKRGENLDEIMKEFGVIVEIPAPEVESDTIVLRGPQDRLVLALTKVRLRSRIHTPDA
jgi:predicted PilT family ATPase